MVVVLLFSLANDQSVASPGFLDPAGPFDFSVYGNAHFLSIDLHRQPRRNTANSRPQRRWRGSFPDRGKTLGPRAAAAWKNSSGHSGLGGQGNDGIYRAAIRGRNPRRTWESIGGSLNLGGVAF
jgi:hypothetical protein